MLDEDEHIVDDDIPGEFDEALFHELVGPFLIQ